MLWVLEVSWRNDEMKVYSRNGLSAPAKANISEEHAKYMTDGAKATNATIISYKRHAFCYTNRSSGMRKI